ncbi:MAG: hypothetical protein MK089_05935 [Phycisphaerales bacterium]|nr:hypothetical protein [Phycisphaerales bacterium]
MNAYRAIVAATVLGLSPVCAAAGGGLETEPVQWTAEEGGNGHWYWWISTPEGPSWSSCQLQAEALGGNLVVAPTLEERTWCRDTFPESFAIGLFQDVSSDDYAEPGGGWRWVDGTPVGDDLWCIGEPDDGGGQDCAAGFYAVPNACVATGFCGQAFNAMLVEFSSDCNGDGIVDYGQILDGTFEDEDGNGVLDLCEDGILTVDNDLMECPDADFTAIQDAINHAADGDVIQVYPGTYTSSDNYILNLGDKRVSILGLEGPDMTILDCEGQRAAIYCTGFHDSGTRISGFTIMNGYRTSAAPVMIWLREASGPSISDCHIRDCYGQIISSGPNHLGDPVGDPHLIRCTFQNNEYWDALMSFNYNKPIFDDCRFIGNSARYIGFSYWPNNTPKYLNCLFESNEVGTEGVLHARSGSAVEVMNCEFRENHAQASCILGSSSDIGVPGYFLVSETTFCGNMPGNSIGGDWIDLGQNEFNEECASCQADVYPDGLINIGDLLIVLANYGSTDPVDGDANGDGLVNADDILMVLSHWGICE